MISTTCCTETNIVAMRTETEYCYGHGTFICIMRVWANY